MLAGESAVSNLTPVPKLVDLLADPGRMSLVPSEAIPAMLGDLERLKAILWAQLTFHQGNGV